MTLVGCGSGGGSLSGKVSHKGAPVKGGSLQFSPIGDKDAKNPGKPVGVKINEDGTFTATENAVAGKHRVTYTAPILEVPGGRELKPGESPPKSPFDGLVPKTQEIDIASGANTLEIELVAPSAKRK